MFLFIIYIYFFFCKCLAIIFIFNQNLEHLESVFLRLLRSTCRTTNPLPIFFIGRCLFPLPVSIILSSVIQEIFSDTILPTNLCLSSSFLLLGFSWTCLCIKEFCFLHAWPVHFNLLRLISLTILGLLNMSISLWLCLFLHT